MQKNGDDGGYEESIDADFCVESDQQERSMKAEHGAKEDDQGCERKHGGKAKAAVSQQEKKGKDEIEVLFNGKGPEVRETWNQERVPGGYEI